jgi:hypothetical protein
MLVCVGIPTIDGKLHANTVDSLLADTLLGHSQGVHYLVKSEMGCSLIGAARNKLVKWFLETSQADCLIFIDSDISWKGGTLTALAKRPQDVVGGTYRAKTDDVKFHVRGLPEQVDDLMRVEGLPGGFIKIKRSVFERMDNAEPYTTDQGEEMRNWFPTQVVDGSLWGEDYGFCRLWRAKGGEVFLDPAIQLRHHDGFRAYTGDPLEWIKEQVNG